MKCENLKRKTRFVINNDAILKYQCYTNLFENWIVGLLDSMGKTLFFFLVLFKGFRLFMEKQDLLNEHANIFEQKLRNIEGTFTC